MFGFLKDKLKEAINKFSKNAEEAAEVIEEAEETRGIKKKESHKKEKKAPEKKEIKKEKLENETKKIEKKEKKKIDKIDNKENIEVLKAQEKQIFSGPRKSKRFLKEPIVVEQEKKKGSFFGKLFKKKETEEETFEAPKKREKEEKSEPEEKEGKKGFFEKISERITKVSLSEKKFDELFWELELTLLENNVAVEVIEKIKGDLKKDLVDKLISRKNIGEEIVNSLKNSIESLFDVEKVDLIKEAKKKKPYIIAIIGINGSGKTTTLAKIAHLLKKNKLEPVVAACDTFRAAAIQQLEEHTTKLGVKLIKQDYGSDPAAIAFDAIEHAKSRGKDVVLIDTAGRLHSDKNLMQELEKIIRVSKPDLKIFVGESIAGNDVVEQVKYFNDKVGIDAIILSKADTDEKGGAAISVSYITGKPIMYLGVGQKYDDLEEFDKKKLMKQIGLE
ncbi:MAG: signal recognition particle-docking protein FtsY [Nanoarchaeota archaeon]